MKNQRVVIAGKIRLKHFDSDYCGRLDKGKSKALTEQHGQRIGDLQQLLYANSLHAVLLIFQGMDASGKDGSIRNVLRFVNPAGVETANFKVPSAEESAHDFLWRIHKAVPRRGNIGVFNRSHYEAVLAERVLELAPKKVWSRRYEQIVDFERMLVENNVLVLKFYLHISRAEQAVRFKERLANPQKNWKFSHADLTTQANRITEQVQARRPSGLADLPEGRHRAARTDAHRRRQERAVPEHGRRRGRHGGWRELLPPSRRDPRRREPRARDGQGV